MNIKKLFAILAGVSMVANVVLPGLAHAATPDTELGKAYEWAYSKSITTMPSYEAANMKGKVTRAELAKMLSNWAMNVRGMTPDTSKTCEFTDTASVKGDLGPAIKTSCQLGLMGQGIPAFRPYDNVSRAEFGTALSRALWGGKYDGGTPYYKNHLQALQAAGIMNYIDGNWPASQEVRGYVMLMLMRVAEWETVDPETPSDEVVKSGDLMVTAESAPSRKIVQTGISDLDTLTFKTSEDVSISKVTLERYGYSYGDSIKGVWLEDQDGNVIAESKTLTKDKVTLSIKKDYRKVDGTFEATIVVETDNASGSTLGFKVTDVESTAKNVDLKNYSPYTYDIVDYTAADATVEIKGTAKNYNYEEGKSYEIARVKAKAGGSAISVNGFTLTNLSGLDMKEFLDKLVVKADSKELKAKYSVNKDDELVVSFDAVELAINKSVTFVLEASFKDFDDYGEGIAYYIAETSHFNATEKKNGTRINVLGDVKDKTSAKLHVFNGGKIKLSNTKLGNVDAAQASEGTVVAEGNITITEPISKLTFTVAADENAKYIENLFFVVDGEEYEWILLGTGNWDLPKCQDNTKFFNVWDYCEWSKIFKVGTAWSWQTPATTPLGLTEVEALYNFKNVSIDKSGKVQFKVDIKDPATPITGSPSINFKSAFGKAAFDGARYDNTNKNVSTTDVAGSISFSKVTIQAAKAALENNLTKAVEFLQNETSRKVVFDWTYTARKWKVNLNKVKVSWASLGSSNDVTFYVSIDGEEVANVDLDKEESFSEIEVKAGESVKVKVEAEVDAYWSEKNPGVSYTVELQGTDANGNENAGVGSDATAEVRVKAKWSITIPSTAEQNTALIKAQNTKIAEFRVKPSNGSEGIMLEDLILSGTIDGTTQITWGMIRVKVAGVEQSDPTGTTTLTYSVNEELPTEWLLVEVTLKKEYIGNVELEVVEVNGKPFGNVYSKYLVESLVNFVEQNEGSTSTTYKLSVENSDDAYSISNFEIYYQSGNSCSTTDKKIIWNVRDGETFTIYRTDNVQEFCKIKYDVMNGTTPVQSPVEIDKVTYKDFFKVGWKELAVPKA